MRLLAKHVFRDRMMKKWCGEEGYRNYVYDAYRSPTAKAHKRFRKYLCKLVKLIPNPENGDCLMSSCSATYDPWTGYQDGESWFCNLCGKTCAVMRERGCVEDEDCLLHHLRAISRIVGMKQPKTNFC